MMAAADASPINLFHFPRQVGHRPLIALLSECFGASKLFGLTLLLRECRWNFINSTNDYCGRQIPPMGWMEPIGQFSKHRLQPSAAMVLAVPILDRPLPRGKAEGGPEDQHSHHHSHLRPFHRHRWYRRMAKRRRACTPRVF